MKKVKYLVIVTCILVLAAVGHVGYQAYPVWKLNKMMNDAASFDYKIRLHADNPYDVRTNALFLLSGEECLIRGSYSGNKAHGTCYDQEGTNSFLEFYRDENGETTVNLGPLLNYMITYVSDQAQLPIDSILSFFQSSMNLYVKDSQFQTVTGMNVMPESVHLTKLKTLDILKCLANKAAPAESYYMDFVKEMRCYKLDSEDTGNTYLGIGSLKKEQIELYLKTEIDSQPVEMMIDLQLNQWTEDITIPESELSDVYLDMLKGIFDMIMDQFGFSSDQG